MYLQHIHTLHNMYLQQPLARHGSQKRPTTVKRDLLQCTYSSRSRASSSRSSCKHKKTEVIRDLLQSKETYYSQKRPTTASSSRSSC